MFKKLSALSKFEVNIALDNKGLFIYTLVFPALYFIYAFVSSNHDLTNLAIRYHLLGFWSYIILTGVLNQVITAMISMRENSFLKMFTFISGDRRLIFYANLIPQTLVIQAEILIFDIIAAVFYRPDLEILEFMFACWLLNFIIIPVVAFYTSFLLAIPMRAQTLGVFMMGYLLLALLLSYGTTSKLLNILLVIVNPSSFVVDVYSLFFAQTDLMTTLITVSVAGIAYVIVGNVIVAKMSLNSVISR